MLAEDGTMINVRMILNLQTDKVMSLAEKAGRQGLRDTVVAITADAKKGSPVLTGHNRRSIMWEVGPGGNVAKGSLQGAVYSTSGYGGYLETGTSRMSARPYFKPALDMNIKSLPGNIKTHFDRM